MTTDHDTLCPELWRWDDGQPCMFCALITRVREDERINGDERDPLYCTHSYKKAIRDAVAAVQSVYCTTDRGEIVRQGGTWENALDRAIAAIENLDNHSTI